MGDTVPRMTRGTVSAGRNATVVSSTRRLLLVSLVCALAGCKTDFHLTDASAGAFLGTTVSIFVETDMDLESPKWKDHMLQFRYVVVQGGDCLTGSALERAKQDIDESSRIFEVNDFRDVPDAKRRQLIEENGAVESLGTIAPGRWRYRIRIPVSEVEDDSGEDYSYTLEPGCVYWITGRIVVIKYMLEPWAESDLLIARVSIPAK
ncbi:MAG: hypothetical protein K8T20_14405 [Planctomycetes bacterium]|nr:hypothetical protein [Planctomycetota bacterium]